MNSIRHQAIERINTRLMELTRRIIIHSGRKDDFIDLCHGVESYNEPLSPVIEGHETIMAEAMIQPVGHADCAGRMRAVMSLEDEEPSDRMRADKWGIRFLGGEALNTMFGLADGSFGYDRLTGSYCLYELDTRLALLEIGHYEDSVIEFSASGLAQFEEVTGARNPWLPGLSTQDLLAYERELMEWCDWVFTGMDAETT